MSVEALTKQFPKYVAREAGDLRPNFEQLRKFAKVTHVPFGSLLLSESLQQTFPIPSLRTVGGRSITRPSPNLLDTVYLCELRQDRYHHHALSEELDPVPLARSATTADPIEDVTATIRAAKD